MKKPVIGIDLDDTLIEFVAGFAGYHNRVYSTRLAHEHFTTWQIHEVLGCTAEEALRRGVEFYHSDDHMQLGAVPGAKNALTLLRAKYDLIGITAREPVRRPRMMEVVERHFADLLSSVHFLGHNMKKGDFCTAIGGMQFMVDDGLHNAQSVGEQGIRVYLLDRPWNQCADLPPNTIRIFHWDDILRHEL